MKKVIYLFVSVLFAGATFVSCSSDDNNGGSSSSIVGSWEFYQEGYSIGSQEVVLGDYEHTEGCSKDYIQFRADGTATDHYFYGTTCEEETDDAAYTTSGNNITVTYQGDEGEEVVSGTYEINSNILTIRLSETYMGVTYNVVSVLKRK